jgi:hypothetical protein
MTQVKPAEPPSQLRPPLFMIGRDRRGNWVVQDEKRIRGGLFVDRDAALRFVRAENADQPRAVVVVFGVLELDMSRVDLGRIDMGCAPGAAPSRGFSVDAQPQRRIA